MLVGTDKLSTITDSVTKLRNNMGIDAGTSSSNVDTIYSVDLTTRLTKFISSINAKYPDADVHDIRTVFMIATEIYLANSGPSMNEPGVYYRNILMDMICEEISKLEESGEMYSLHATADIIPDVYDIVSSDPDYGVFKVNPVSMAKIIPLRWVVVGYVIHLHVGLT